MSFSKIAKKHLGQNFLIDPRVKERIITAAAITDADTVLEIGPGLGALTEQMIERGATVYAIEKDASLAKHLTAAISSPHLHIIQEDFLKCDLEMLPPITKVIGNIPYNISSPIIERLIAYRHKIPRAFLTTQLEFGKRLAAGTHTKDYGALTCLAQYYTDVHILFKISPQCFRPVPKVTSCFLQLEFRPPAHKAMDESLLFIVTRTAFQQRRKKIENALTGFLSKENIQEILHALHIEGGSRADQVALTDYVNISNAITLRRDCSHSNQKTNGGQNSPY